MPRVEKDITQEGVYYFRETEEEKKNRIERETLAAALAELQAEMQKARPGWKPTVKIPDPRNPK